MDSTATLPDFEPINLASPDHRLKINRYPDGQQDVTFNLPSTPTGTVRLLSRLTSWRDLELIVAANQSLRNLGAKVELVVSYFLGARADRIFQPGMCHYLRDVICPVVNAQQFERVEVLDPHSDVLCGLLQRSTALPGTHFKSWIEALPEHVKILYPDAGAEKRYSTLLLGRASFQARKHRDLATGKILETTILGDVAGQDLVIIDDLCDGGRTFLEHAECAKRRGANKLSLAVTHGVFSQGFDRLFGVFDRIFTTNSYRDFEPHPQLTVAKVI